MRSLEQQLNRAYRRQQQAMALLGEPHIHREAPRVPIGERDRRSPRYLVLQLLRQRDGTACYLCGTALDIDQSCVEHIIPISRGGTNEPNNVAIACFTCNLQKADQYVSLTTPSGIPMYHQPR